MTPLAKGPRSAEILVIGEAPGEAEQREGIPFVGASGKELDALLREAGLDPVSLRITNVCHERPPKNDISKFIFSSKKEAKLHPDAQFLDGRYYTTPIRVGMELLRMEIDSMPNLRLIIGLGNLPLWALTGSWGITSWRGSQMFTRRLTNRPIPFVPTLHPAYVMRVWDDRWKLKLDLKRARVWKEKRFHVPEYNFIVRPSYARVREYLNHWLSLLDIGCPVKLAVDLETRLGHIACLGLAHSKRDAICIPFLTVNGPYWSSTEECGILWLLYRLLTHPLFSAIGQNFNYDQQYFAKRLGFKVNLQHDTMTKQHLCFPGIEKGLDFLSSQYCEYHLYWKDESKEWDHRLGEETLWIYNCKDCVTTFEANAALDGVIRDFSHGPRLINQMEMMDIALDMMLRGIRTDLERKRRVADEIEQVMLKLLGFVNKCLGFNFILPETLLALKKIRHFNPASPKQVASLAYDVLKLSPQWKRTDEGRRLTADKEAIKEWTDKAEPIFRPLLKAIADFRSLQVYRSTFALAELDHDGRWRCSINVAGPHTFRFSTGIDAFGFGSNMQNLPSGNEDD